MSDLPPTSPFVTRDEFFEVVREIKKSIGAIFDRIDSLGERRGASTRQVWLGVGGMFLTAIALGASLVYFAISGATEPLSVNQRAIMEGLERISADFRAEVKESAYQRGRYDLIEGLVLGDTQIRHGAGADEVLSQSKIEVLENRFGELWQLEQTLNLKIEKMAQEMAASQAQGPNP